MTETATHETDATTDGSTPASSSPPPTERVGWRPPTRFPEGNRRCLALFRRTAAEWVLQHVRDIHTRQRGPASTATIDAGVTLDDLPDEVRRRAERQLNDPLRDEPDPLADPDSGGASA